MCVWVLFLFLPSNKWLGMTLGIFTCAIQKELDKVTWHTLVGLVRIGGVNC